MLHLSLSLVHTEYNLEGNETSDQVLDYLNDLFVHCRKRG